MSWLLKASSGKERVNEVHEWMRNKLLETEEPVKNLLRYTPACIYYLLRPNTLLKNICMFVSEEEILIGRQRGFRNEIIISSV